MFLRWLLILGLLFAGIRFLLRQSGRRNSGAGSRQNASSHAADPNRRLEEMVRDPECGLYLPRSQAIAGGTDSRGNPRYYCSEACRRKHEDR